ncbi:MAG: hypothetical protein H6607_12710 [Flavobacteriales bacterium]|nr:hypothetical protein [Flavobacteriales bacterium]
MKFYKLLFFISIVYLLGGCKVADKFTQFDMEYKTTAIVKSASGINLPFDILTPDVESNSESTFEVNDTRKDLIEEIKLKHLDLLITSPDGQNFDFLKSIAIYISADGLNEIKVAWKDDIPDGMGNNLVLETTENDLKEYIKKDKFNLRLNTVTDKVITNDVYIDVNSIFFVDAKLFK